MKGPILQFTASEISISTERYEKYAGTVKVHISQIKFDPPLTENIDSRKIEHLKKLFAHQHCDRFDANNHIPVIVARHLLEAILQGAGIELQGLQSLAPKDFPLLDFPSGALEALHGRHRIKAALDTFFVGDRWWTVDLYYNDISSDLKSFLVDEYKNESTPSDGEIYRAIRQYETANNHLFRRRWYMRLSKTKRDRLDQLDNPRNRDIRDAFDALLPIRGLWGSGMRISLVSRIIASSCREEVISYLDVIRRTWILFALGNSCQGNLISTRDVEELQLLRPHYSCPESRVIQERILCGDLFSVFSDNDRITIASTLKRFDGIIPSLFTFFEDFKALECWSCCIKRLFGPLEISVKSTMRRIFRLEKDEETEVMVQVDEFNTKFMPVKPHDHFDLAYRQVWLYIVRHYAKMPPDTKKAGRLLVKQDRSIANSKDIFQLAELASRLQFSSPEISKIISNSPDRQLAREVLEKARDPSYYHFDDDVYEGLVDRIVSCFVAAKPSSPLPLRRSYPVARDMRCGMPRGDTYIYDLHFMYPDFLYGQTIEFEGPVSSLLVLHWVFFCFFGPFESYVDLLQAENRAPPANPLVSHMNSREGTRDRRRSGGHADHKSRSGSSHTCDDVKSNRVRRIQSPPMHKDRPKLSGCGQVRVDRVEKADQSDDTEPLGDMSEANMSLPHSPKKPQAHRGKANDSPNGPRPNKPVPSDVSEQHDSDEMYTSVMPPQTLPIHIGEQGTRDSEIKKSGNSQNRESMPIGEQQNASSETRDDRPQGSLTAGQKRKNASSIFEQRASSKQAKLASEKRQSLEDTVKFLKVVRKDNGKEIEHFLTLPRIPDLVGKQLAKYEDKYHVFVGRTKTSSDGCMALMEQQNKFICYLVSKSR